MVNVGKRRLLSVVRGVGRVLLALLCLCIGIWGGFALWYQFPGNVVAKVVAILVWCVPSIWAIRAGFGPVRRWHSLAVFGALFGVMLIW